RHLSDYERRGVLPDSVATDTQGLPPARGRHGVHCHLPTEFEIGERRIELSQFPHLSRAYEIQFKCDTSFVAFAAECAVANVDFVPDKKHLERERRLRVYDVVAALLQQPAQRCRREVVEMRRGVYPPLAKPVQIVSHRLKIVKLVWYIDGKHAALFQVTLAN